MANPYLRVLPMLVSFAALALFAAAQPAHALTMRECSAKYKAAKESGALGGMKWNDFRREECGAAEITAPVTAPMQENAIPSHRTTAGPGLEECTMRYWAAKANGLLGGMTWNDFRKAGCPPTTAAAPAAPVPPPAARTTNESPVTNHAAANLQECSVRYRAAKASGTLGNMTWNEFRRAGCPSTAAMTPAAPAAPTTAGTTTEPTISDLTTTNLQKCSARYQAAKASGMLKGMSWNEFRSAGCPSTMGIAPAAPTTARTTTEPTPPADQATANLQECSARYQAARASGALGGMTWSEFRSAGCPSATAAPITTGAVPAPGLPDLIFPTGISQKYAEESAGRARMHTCRDQYYANKAAGHNELKWTEKGGGYYSECNKRLSAR